MENFDFVVVKCNEIISGLQELKKAVLENEKFKDFELIEVFIPPFGEKIQNLEYPNGVNVFSVVGFLKEKSLDMKRATGLLRDMMPILKSQVSDMLKENDILSGEDREKVLEKIKKCRHDWVIDEETIKLDASDPDIWICSRCGVEKNYWDELQKEF